MFARPAAPTRTPQAGDFTTITAPGTTLSVTNLSSTACHVAGNGRYASALDGVASVAASAVGVGGQSCGGSTAAAGAAACARRIGAGAKPLPNFAAEPASAADAVAAMSMQRTGASDAESQLAFLVYP